MAKETSRAGPRAIWKGAISFGLVHVPVALHSATQEQEVDFDWLDRRSMDPVGYKRVNKRTGKEIAKENIVKGVKLEGDNYVVLSDDEIKAAYPKRTQTIQIETFVKAEDVSFVYIEKPYYLSPDGKAQRVYALLREALAGAAVIGIARFVLHNKEHLAALIPAGPALMLGTLRWANEIRPRPAGGRRVGRQTRRAEDGAAADRGDDGRVEAAGLQGRLHGRHPRPGEEEGQGRQEGDGQAAGGRAGLRRIQCRRPVRAAAPEPGGRREARQTPPQSRLTPVRTTMPPLDGWARTMAWTVFLAEVAPWA
jgi:Ku protein